MKKKGKKKFLVEKVRKGTKGTVCKYCDRVLGDEEQLKKHISQQHGYKCQKCSKVFSSEPSWVNHLRDVHGLSHAQATTDFRKNEIDTWLHKKTLVGEKTVLKRGKKNKKRGKIKSLPPGKPENSGEKMENAAEQENVTKQIKCAECNREGPEPPRMMLGITPRCELLGWGRCIDDDDI